jgi:hypothetical protein
VGSETTMSLTAGCGHGPGVTCQNCAWRNVRFATNTPDITLIDLLEGRICRLEALVESLQRQLIDQEVRPTVSGPYISFDEPSRYPQ